MKQSLEEKFLAACMSSPPDYECMLKLLDDGFDINMEKNDPITGKSLLSQVLLDRNRYYDDDIENKPYEYLEITKFFIANGFDVKRYGGDCLQQLEYSSADEFVLDIAELLLDYGADINDKCDDDDDKSLLECIAWHLGDWVVGDARFANRLNAYYEMVNAYEKGKDYHGIRCFEHCIGKTITSIEKIAFNEEEKLFNVNNRYAFSGGLIFWCDEVP